MNLNESSDNASLDIGMVSETEKEYDNIVSFFKKFLMSNTDDTLTNTESLKVSSKANESNKYKPKQEYINKKRNDNSVTKEKCLYILDSKFNNEYDFHLKTVYEILNIEYQGLKMIFSKNENNDQGIKIIDYPLTGINIYISGTIDFKFNDEYLYNIIMKNNKELFKTTFPSWRLFWNHNVLNIYPPKNISYPITELGLKDKVNYFLFIIRKVCYSVKTTSIPKSAGYNRY